MPESPLVIVNPTAGAGRAGRALRWIRERLTARPDARLVVTERRGHGEELVARIGTEHDRVIVVGGDGTVQEVVNGLVAAGAGASLGIVPVGSGNDLARSLGLPGDQAEAWKLAIGRGQRPIDLLEASGEDGRRRWFSSAGGIGFDAEVAATMATRPSWQRNRVGYLIAALGELRHIRHRRVELTLDGERIEREILLVAMANGTFYGGGMRITPRARVDDGLLDLCIVGAIGRATALRQLPNLYRGTHVDHPAVELRQGRLLEIDGDRETMVHLDGEGFGRLPIRVAVDAGRLTVADRLR